MSIAAASPDTALQQGPGLSRMERESRKSHITTLQTIKDNIHEQRIRFQKPKSAGRTTPMWQAKNRWTHWPPATWISSPMRKPNRETVDLVVEALKGAGFSRRFHKGSRVPHLSGQGRLRGAQGQEAARFGRAPHQRHTDARALTSSSAAQEQWHRQAKTTTTAASANTNGWPGLSPCTA